MEKYPADPIPLLYLSSKAKNINLTPSYQRAFVWSKKSQKKLINTILNNYYIPEVILGIVKEASNSEHKLEVLDGQQRITTILRFINNKITVPEGTIVKDKDISGYFYKDLPLDIKEVVDTFTLNVVKIEGTQKEREEMYRRFQNGESLKKSEIRYSMSGEIKEYIHKMLEHPFFLEGVKFTSKGNKRKKFNEVCEQLILLEIKGITTIKDKNIVYMYDEYNQVGIPKEIKENIMNKLNFLNDAFNNRNSSILAQKINIINVFVVATEYMKNEPDYKHFADEFGMWFKNFEIQRKLQRKLSTDERASKFARYLDAASAGTSDEDSIRKRKEILYESWMHWLGNFKKQNKKENLLINEEINEEIYSTEDENIYSIEEDSL